MNIRNWTTTLSLTTTLATFIVACGASSEDDTQADDAAIVASAAAAPPSKLGRFAFESDTHLVQLELDDAGHCFIGGGTGCAPSGSMTFTNKKTGKTVGLKRNTRAENVTWIEFSAMEGWLDRGWWEYKGYAASVCAERSDGTIFPQACGFIGGGPGGCASASERDPGEPLPDLAPNDLFIQMKLEGDAYKVKIKVKGAEASLCTHYLPADFVLRPKR